MTETVFLIAFTVALLETFLGQPACGIILMLAASALLITASIDRLSIPKPQKKDDDNV